MISTSSSSPVATTSVHPHETNRHDNTEPLPEKQNGQSNVGISFRHSGWSASRRRVVVAMDKAMIGEARRLTFLQCGEDAYVVRSLEDPDRYGIQCSKCKDRFCKPCARERAGVVARNLLNHVKQKELRFCTLTLKTETGDLRWELDRLFVAFRKLQRRKFWRRHVWGGAALVEVKWNDDSNRWHPHLHVLIEGRYVPQTQLATEWKACTGNSWIVDVRAVRDNSRVTRYITKYATDPIDKSVGRNTDRLAEAMRAFRGRRTCTTFGSWRQVELTKQDVEHGWEQIGTLAGIIAKAAEGVDEAQRVLAALWIYDERQTKGEERSNADRGPPDETLFDAPF